MAKTKYKTELNETFEKIFRDTMVHETTQTGGLTSHGIFCLRKALAAISVKYPEITTSQELYKAANAWLLTQEGIKDVGHAGLWLYDNRTTVYEEFSKAVRP
jgi:hypothetical protein